ncbi:hypothetical protein EON78_04760 [bacterium]|nr:MAG: hypothetical protein EON78_04760 [bacterium]
MKKIPRIKIIILASSTLIIGLIVAYNYLMDEKTHILKEYSSTGQLLGTNEYVIRRGDTVLHGKFKNFNDKGRKISEGQFVENEPNGMCLYYYDNGKLEAVHYRKNSKITLESTFYNLDGLVEKYAVYDDFGKESFIISFDNKGVTKYEGHVQIEIYQYKHARKEHYNIKEYQHLKVGDKLKYTYIVANIPNAERSFKIENLGVDNSETNRTLQHILPAQINVEECLIKKGKNTIRSIVQYEFNDKVTPTFIDTLSFDVYVY